MSAPDYTQRLTDRFFHLGKPLGGDNPVLRQMAAQRIH